MNYGLYLSAAALRIQEYRQAALANNLANASTTSFKPDMILVRSRPPAPEEQNLPSYLHTPILDDVRGGLAPGGGHTDFSQGRLTQTGGELDVALTDEGFFTVRSAGQIRYTRDGRFARDSEGYLVTAAGSHRVLDDGGLPIRLPAGTVRIDEQGLIRVDDYQARLAVRSFEDLSRLRKAGENTYMAGEAAPRPSAARVRQGCLEASGVDQVRSMVEMMQGHRMYEASARLIQLTDGILERAVNDIAKISG